MGTNDEHNEQAALIDWCNNFKMYAPELEWIFAVPSGGHRHKKVATYMKIEGAKAGVPDLLLLCARFDFHGLGIEMKSTTGRVREVQWKWTGHLSEEGYLIGICYSFEEARDLLLDYLGYKEERDEYDITRLEKTDDTSYDQYLNRAYPTEILRAIQNDRSSES